MPVAIAIALYVIKFVLAPLAVEVWPTRLAATSPGFLPKSPTTLVADVIVTGLLIALGYGLWRGSNVSRFLVLLLAAFSLLLGAIQLPGFASWPVVLWLPQMAAVAAVALLLLIPPLSRAWFTHDKPARNSALDPSTPIAEKPIE